MPEARKNPARGNHGQRNVPQVTRVSERERVKLKYRELIGLVQELTKEHDGLREAYNEQVRKHNQHVERTTHYINVLLTEVQFHKLLLLELGHTHSVVLNRMVPFDAEQYAQRLDRYIAEKLAKAQRAIEEDEAQKAAAKQPTPETAAEALPAGDPPTNGEPPTAEVPGA